MNRTLIHRRMNPSDTSGLRHLQVFHLRWSRWAFSQCNRHDRDSKCLFSGLSAFRDHWRLNNICYKKLSLYIEREARFFVYSSGKIPPIKLCPVIICLTNNLSNLFKVAIIMGKPINETTDGINLGGSLPWFIGIFQEWLIRPYLQTG